MLALLTRSAVLSCFVLMFASFNPANSFSSQQRWHRTQARYIPATASTSSHGLHADGGDAAKANQLWTLPNKLSASRIAMIPALGLLWGNPKLRAAVFALASITDLFDGYLARKMRLTSRFGTLDLSGHVFILKLSSHYTPWFF